LVLIAESAPDRRAVDRPFFYAPTLTGADNLFRGVLLSLFHHPAPGA